MADTLNGLIAEWRGSDEWMTHDDGYQSGRKGQLKVCADQLEQFRTRLVELRDRWRKTGIDSQEHLDLLYCADELSELIGEQKP